MFLSARFYHLPNSFPRVRWERDSWSMIGGIPAAKHSSESNPAYGGSLLNGWFTTDLLSLS